MSIFHHIGPEQIQLETAKTPMNPREKHESQLLQELQEMFTPCSVTEICNTRCGSDWHRFCAQGECLYFQAMLEESDSKPELTFVNNLQQDNAVETWQLKNANGFYAVSKELFAKLPEQKRSSPWLNEVK